LCLPLGPPSHPHYSSSHFFYRALPLIFESTTNYRSSQAQFHPSQILVPSHNKSEISLFWILNEFSSLSMSNQDPPRFPDPSSSLHYQPIFIPMYNRYKYLLIFIYPIPNTTREKTVITFVNQIARINTTISHHDVYWRKALVITNGGGLLVFLRREETVNIEISSRSMRHSQCGNFGDAAQQS
jgi:hypothetical protein